MDNQDKELGFSQSKWMQDMERLLRRADKQSGVVSLLPESKWMQDMERLLRRADKQLGVVSPLPQSKWMEDINKVLGNAKSNLEIATVHKPTWITAINDMFDNSIGNSAFQVIVPGVMQLGELIAEAMEEESTFEDFLKQYNELTTIDVVEQDGKSELSTIEISNEMQEVISQNAEEYRHTSIEHRIANFFQALSLKHPIVKFVFVFIILPYYISLFAGFSNEEANLSPQEVIKNTRYEVHLSSDEENYSNIRIVNKDELQIKKLKKWASTTIDTLPRGTIVYKNIKNKNWMLVTYFDEENGEFISGWTLTRYLKTIK